MKRRIPLPKLFLIATGIMSFFALVSAICYTDSTIDIHLHDTYIIFAHFHVFIVLAFCLLVIAGLYYVIPKLSGRRVYYGPGLFHLIVTISTAILLFWPVQHEGIAAGPRRYYDYSAWESFRQITAQHPATVWVTMLFFLAQLVFVVNLLVSAIAGRRVSAGPRL